MMKLLERLKPLTPRNRGKRCDLQYEITKRLIPEIDEARAAGYSWAQICNAIGESLREQGEWNEADWHRYDFEKCYRQIMKEGSTCTQ